MEKSPYNSMSHIFFIIILLRPYNNQEIPEQMAVNVDNWTTCDEFLGNHTFNATNVVDIDWQIFYFWSYLLEESYHIRFSLPNKELIERFKEELDEEQNPPVNWTDAEFFMETSIDFSGLFIKTNKSGLYRLIPSLALSYVAVPTTTIIGLRVVEPGYLGLVKCKYKLSYALAPVEKMPPYDHLDEAALKLGIWSEYNRSYLFAPPLPIPLPKEDPFDEQDDEDDEQVEIDHDPDRMEFL